MALDSLLSASFSGLTTALAIKTELSLQLRSVEAITDIACVLPSGSRPSGIQVHPLPSEEGLIHAPCSELAIRTQCSLDPCLPDGSSCVPQLPPNSREGTRAGIKITTFLPEEFPVLGKKLTKEVIPHTVVNASLYLAMNFSNRKIRAEPGSVMRCLTVA